VGYDRRRLGPTLIQIVLFATSNWYHSFKPLCSAPFTDNPKSSELTALALVWVIENVRAPLCL
jgi:hypothetical protein